MKSCVGGDFFMKKKLIQTCKYLTTATPRLPLPTTKTTNTTFQSIQNLKISDPRLS